MRFELRKLVIAALFAAFICVATLIIRIPTPGTSGYVHPGDAIVILSGIFLGPVYGFLAAGIGSCMADLFGGYMLYVPVTFFIKGLVALVAALLFMRIGRSKKSRTIAVSLGGVSDIILVAGGYFAFEYFIYGIGAAASIPANLVQGITGLIIALMLYPLLYAIPDLRRLNSCEDGSDKRKFQVNKGIHRN